MFSSGARVASWPFGLAPYNSPPFPVSCYSPVYWPSDISLFTIQGSFPCSNKEIMLGLEIESPVYRRKWEQERKTEHATAIPEFHTQSPGHQAREVIIGRAREWNDVCMEDKRDETSSIAVVLKVLEQKNHHLGTCQKYIFSVPTPDILIRSHSGSQTFTGIRIIWSTH